MSKEVTRNRLGVEFGIYARDLRRFLNENIGNVYAGRCKAMKAESFSIALDFHGRNDREWAATYVGSFIRVYEVDRKTMEMKQLSKNVSTFLEAETTLNTELGKFYLVQNSMFGVVNNFIVVHPSELI